MNKNNTIRYLTVELLYVVGSMFYVNVLKKPLTPEGGTSDVAAKLNGCCVVGCRFYVELLSW